uniref:Uncharacterized protein n=1 Tax=Megaviridae environmental sample TaxID=1737588 RepID=A0A5J6VH13_9VIRU|nr:MAG: hypothetical protein [Megaviridae environmental sample]
MKYRAFLKQQHYNNHQEQDQYKITNKTHQDVCNSPKSLCISIPNEFTADQEQIIQNERVEIYSNTPVNSSNNPPIKSISSNNPPIKSISSNNPPIKSISSNNPPIKSISSNNPPIKSISSNKSISTNQFIMILILTSYILCTLNMFKFKLITSTFLILENIDQHLYHIQVFIYKYLIMFIKYTHVIIKKYITRQILVNV